MSASAPPNVARSANRLVAHLGDAKSSDELTDLPIVILADLQVRQTRTQLPRDRRNRQPSPIIERLRQHQRHRSTSNIDVTKRSKTTLHRSPNSPLRRWG